LIEILAPVAESEAERVAPLDLEVWWVGEVRDGRNLRIEYFMDEESARQAFEVTPPD
jgi:hypothetical protein